MFIIAGIYTLGVVVQMTKNPLHKKGLSYKNSEWRRQLKRKNKKVERITKYIES